MRRRTSVRTSGAVSPSPSRPVRSGRTRRVERHPLAAPQSRALSPLLFLTPQKVTITALLGHRVDARSSEVTTKKLARMTTDPCAFTCLAATSSGAAAAFLQTLRDTLRKEHNRATGEPCASLSKVPRGRREGRQTPLVVSGPAVVKGEEKTVKYIYSRWTSPFYLGS